MKLSSGTLVGPYRIGRKLGAGGMGDVYHATHVVLGREVALKTLRTEAGSGNAQCSPLVREARAASALDHPNIVTVYDVGDFAGTLFIAMEYIEGQTLRRLLESRKLRTKEVLQYALQIARALAAAHDAGILHRDIKPGNIMITRKNVVKVVDFGLAKAFHSREHADQANFATHTIENSRLARKGRPEAGTIGYMSPEQIRGAGCDARSDIFSFGIVLYEMLTYVRPFTAPSDIAVTANILNTEPRPVRELAPDVPPELDGLVQFCLRKEPESRARSMHDIAYILETTLQSREARHEMPGAHAKQIRWRLVGGVTALALVAAWATGMWVSAFGAKAKLRGALRRITWDGGLSESPALSDDGQLIAFASDRAGGKNLDLFVRHMSGGEPIRLTHNSAGDTDPSFSPDGGMIAFHSERHGGGIYLMPSFGGQEHLIAPRGNNPRFSPDGKWIAYWVGESTNTAPSARAYVVSVNGGAIKPVQPSFADARFPIWTPDGTHLLFQGVDVWNANTDVYADWWVTPLSEGKATKTGAWDSIQHSGLPYIYPPGGWHHGKVVFSARDDAARFVLSIPISTRNWKVQAQAEALTFGTGIEGYPYPAPSGAIAFTSYEYEINIWSRRLDERGRGVGEARKLTVGAAYHSSASMDINGTRLAFLVGRSPNRSVGIRDLVSGRESVVAADSTDKCSAAISPDGSRVAWSVCGPGREAIYVAAINSDLSVPVSDRVCEDCGRVIDWSRTTDSLLFVDHSKPVRIGVLTLSSGSRVMISSALYNLDKARFSPDGNWIAATAVPTRDDRAQILAIPWREGKPAPEGDWVAVTDGTSWNDNPAWTDRGDSLLYYSKRDGFGCIWRQAVNPVTKRPEGEPAEVIDFHGGRLSIKELGGFLPSLDVVSHHVLFNALERTGSIWVLYGEPEKRRKQ